MEVLDEKSQRTGNLLGRKVILVVFFFPLHDQVHDGTCEWLHICLCAGWFSFRNRRKTGEYLLNTNLFSGKKKKSQDSTMHFIQIKCGKLLLIKLQMPKIKTENHQKPNASVQFFFRRGNQPRYVLCVNVCLYVCVLYRSRKRQHAS